VQAGFVVFDLGAGSFGDHNDTRGTDITWWIRGRGKNRSFLGNITNPGRNITVYDTDGKSFFMYSVTTDAPASSGLGGGAQTYYDCAVNSTSLLGMHDDGTGDPTAGGNLALFGSCEVGYCSSGGGYNTSSGSGASGGLVRIDGPSVITGSIDFPGGSGGSFGANGGVAIVRGGSIPSPNQTPSYLSIEGGYVDDLFIATTAGTADGTASPVNSITTRGGVITSIS
jgi:hypothetical protein